MNRVSEFNMSVHLHLIMGNGTAGDLDLECLIFRKLKLLQTKVVIEKTWGDANSDVTRLRLTTRQCFL